MSLVEEVLAKHLSCESYGTPAHEKPCCLRCFGDVEWPCPTVRLATELQNAQAVVEAAREVTRLVFDTDEHVPLTVSETLRTALARYDEGRKA